MSRWFRFYSDAVNNRKVQALPGELFKAWVNILCLFCAGDGRALTTDDIAFGLRLSVSKARPVIDALIDRRLLEENETGVTPHDWNERQYKSDGSSERVAKYRERRKANGLPVVSDYSRFRGALIERDGEQCVYCGSTTNLVVDHMVPIAMGGEDVEDNLALACRRCNSGKAGRTPELAGVTITVASAADALARYRDTKRDVTVTVTPPEQNRADTEQNRTDKREIDSDFEAWYREYPRHEGRGQALKAYRAARKKLDADGLLAAARRARERYRGTEPKFIPLPATFLNGERWLDEPAQSAESGPDLNDIYPPEIYRGLQ
jgi:hypothetical protein